MGQVQNKISIMGASLQMNRLVSDGLMELQKPTNVKDTGQPHHKSAHQLAS